MSTELVRPGNGTLEIYRTWTPDALREEIAREKELRTIVIEYYRESMQEGHHFYRIDDDPKKKPSLSKEGALNLCNLFKVRAEPDAPVETLTADGHYTVRYRMNLVSIRTGEIVAYGDGLCTTRESRYAYRWAFASEVPSNIDREQLIKRERQSKTGKPYIQYKLPNQDLADLYNVVLKMSEKRALVDGVLKLPLASELFTQDLEEQLQEGMQQKRQVREAHGDPEDAEEDPTAVRPTIEEIDALIELMREAYEQNQAVVRTKIREAMEIPSGQSLNKGQIRSGMTTAQHDTLKADAERALHEKNPPSDTEDDVGDFAGPESNASQEPQATTPEPTEGYSGPEQVDANQEAASSPDADAATESPATTPAPESGESDVGKFASAKQIGALKFMAQQLGNDAYADVRDMEQHWPQGIPISVYERVKARLDERKKSRKAGAQATTEV
jgi:hypothetical protein